MHFLFVGDIEPAHIYVTYTLVCIDLDAYTQTWLYRS